MVEAGEGSEQTYQDRFAAIEAAVDAGETDLGRIGFWRLLRDVKVDPRLCEHWADQAGRIDRKAFDRAIRVRFPVWLGNLLLLAGTALGAAGIVVSLRAEDELVAGLALLVAAGAWSVCLHGLAHWALGRAVGIRFLHYFFRPGQFPPRPGIKTDYASYLRAAPGERALMHAAGAVATKVAPFVALAFWPASNAPAWAAWAVAALGVFQIVTDVAFSTKTGDWKKVRRERAVARGQSARRA